MLRKGATVRTVQYQGESEGVRGQRAVGCPCVGEDPFEYGTFKFVGVGLGLSHGSSGSLSCLNSGFPVRLGQTE